MVFLTFYLKSLLPPVSYAIPYSQSLLQSNKSVVPLDINVYKSTIFYPSAKKSIIILTIKPKLAILNNMNLKSHMSSRISAEATGHMNLKML